MKVVTVFPYLQIFERYYAQFKAIRDRVDELYVLYCSGSPCDEWRKDFVFVKFMEREFSEKKVGWRKDFGVGAVTRALRLNTSVKYSCRRIVESLDVDLVYALSSYFPQLIGSYVARKNGIAYVCRPQGDLQRELYMKQNYLAYLYFFNVLLKGMCRADRVLPITREMYRECQYWGIPLYKLARPIGLGVDTEKFKKVNEHGNDFVVGYAGRLSREKGIFRLLELAIALPHVSFRIAGRLQEDVEFPSNVEYAGFIPHSKMCDFYNSVSVILMPSFMEGFPNTIVESYACETPVVATHQAMPEELDVFGAVVRIENFAKAIRFLSECDLASIGSEARAYVVASHTWDHFGYSVVSEFERAVRRKAITHVFHDGDWRKVK